MHGSSSHETSSLSDLLTAQPDARALHLEVRRATLAAGRPVDGVSLAVVLLAKAERDGPLRRWTAGDVDEMVWVDIVSWCHRHGVDAPQAAGEALWALLDHLTATGSLAAGSDARAALRAPLIAAGGLDAQGRSVRGRAAHPSEQGRPRLADVIPLVS